MKPRTGDGPLEVTKEGRGIVMRVPLEGGGRLVVELTADEAARLGDALKSVVGDPIPALLVAPLDRGEQAISERQQHRDEPVIPRTW
jgi:hypothetical protein